VGDELAVAGAGMAGLAAAARARELGARVVVYEKGARPGGSMRLSSGVVWRFRNWEAFRDECPGGDPALQRLVWERLDEALAWLEALGAPVLARETGNPRTTGVRFDPDGLTQALAQRAGELRLGDPLRRLPEGASVVLATGGFQGDRELVRRHITAEPLLLRANPWSTGDGLRLALALGARPTAGLDEFYGRNLAAAPRIAAEDFVPLAQVYARHATVENARGERFHPSHWADVDVVQWTARQPGARAWYTVPDEALGEPVDDERARAAEGLWAAGADVGGISTGGWSSALAAALVLGLAAAEDAVG
jgi:succinate dehydrogenase/fumarate reductase flavoprotein subunit